MAISTLKKEVVNFLIKEYNIMDFGIEEDNINYIISLYKQGSLSFTESSVNYFIRHFIFVIRINFKPDLHFAFYKKFTDEQVNIFEDIRKEMNEICEYYNISVWEIIAKIYSDLIF